MKTPDRPAPLEVIRQKLASSNEGARLVALRHAAAHGEEARSLAATVAGMFEDESPAVQFSAVHTFRSVGRGAADAVPVLLALRARGSPPMLVARATFCLGSIGPAAQQAVPTLKQALEASPDDEAVLQALFAIAPDDEDVAGAVVRAAFSQNYFVARAAFQALERGDGAMLDRVLAEAFARATSRDPGSRRASAVALVQLASKRPGPAAAALRKLLVKPDAPEVAWAVGAVARLPAPRPPDLVSAVIGVAAARVPAREAALKAIAEMGPEATRAEPVLLRVIDENGTGIPLPGEKGEAARSLAAAAAAFVVTCPSGPSEKVVDALVSWMRRVARARKPREGFSWYPIGAVLEVVATLAPGDDRVGEVLLALVAKARTCIDEDESGVLDFDRCVRRAMSRLPAASELYSRAEKLGMPREDPYSGDREPDRPADALPDFPNDDESSKIATVASLDEAEEIELGDAVVRARGILKIAATSSPGEVAIAVDRWIRRVKRESTAVSEETLFAIAAAYGQAILDVTGWAWRIYSGQGSEEHALVSLDLAYVHLPRAYVSRQIDPTTEVTALLYFNMLAEGSVPEARPGTLTLLA